MLIELVAGRHCGECTVCCVDLTIDTEEHKKLPGVRCPHLCASGGCGIYETRYPVCREYYCGWRYMDFLGDEWRPDKSGVLFDFVPQDELPANRLEGPNLRVVLLAPPPVEMMRTLCDYIARLIAGGVLVVLAVPGPRGHYPAHSILNDSLQEAATSGDLARIEAALSEGLSLSKAASHHFSPVVFKSGNQ